MCIRDSFWIVGRRLGPRRVRRAGDPGRRPVIFIHGYAQNRVDFLFLASRLRRRGFDALFGFNYAWVSTLEASAARLDRFVEEVCAECEVDRVDLVCHSMGGLVAMQYLHSPSGTRRVARCVTLATPFGGVRWRGPLLGRAAIALRKGFPFPEGPPASLPVALLSVFSRHDNVVHPASTTSLERVGGRHHEAGTMGHLVILFDGQGADVVADFLLEEAPVARSEVVVGPSE